MPLSAVALKGYRLHGAGCEAAGQVLAPHPLHVAAGPGSAAYEIACPPMATFGGHAASYVYGLRADRPASTTEPEEGTRGYLR